MRIAIVDDNSLVRKTIREFIEDESDDIIEFSKGEKLVYELVEGMKEPDWILLGIKMTGLNGFETAEVIQRTNPNVNIGFVTNYDQFFYCRKTNEFGAEFIISKRNLSGLKDQLKLKSI